jgi:hypothetical protein
MEIDRIAVALRDIGRGLTALADALEARPDAPTEEDRQHALMSDWGRRGLTRPQTSELFRRHGFSPQAAGGWARGGWMELRPDGLRYLTARSLHWLDEREPADES